MRGRRNGRPMTAASRSCRLRLRLIRMLYFEARPSGFLRRAEMGWVHPGMAGVARMSSPVGASSWVNRGKQAPVGRFTAATIVVLEGDLSLNGASGRATASA